MLISNFKFKDPNAYSAEKKAALSKRGIQVGSNGLEVVNEAAGMERVGRIIIAKRKKGRKAKQNPTKNIKQGNIQVGADATKIQTLNPNILRPGDGSNTRAKVPSVPQTTPKPQLGTIKKSASKLLSKRNLAIGGGIAAAGALTGGILASRKPKKQNRWR